MPQHNASHRAPQTTIHAAGPKHPRRAGAVSGAKLQ
jgi:hypothetical protein